MSRASDVACDTLLLTTRVTCLPLAGAGRRGALLPMATRAAGRHRPVQQGRQEIGVGQIPRTERDAPARHVREGRVASRVLLGPGALTV